MSGTNSIRNKLRGIIASALAVVLFAALGTSGHAANIDLDKDCTLKVSPTTETADDIKDANVVVDLYYVASAIAVDGYDTYDLQAESAFASLDVTLDSEKTAEDWEDIAQQAAAIALAEGSTVKAAVEGKELDKDITGLKAGLYLVVPHGSDVEEYVETIKNEDGDEVIVTIANSPTYKYSFTPNLIALPTKEGENGVISTAGTGEWLDTVGIELKAEREERNGSLEIVKSFNEFVMKYTDPVTVVFEVHVFVDGEEKTEYNKTVSMVFTSGAQQVKLYDDLPVGATVVVTEVYSGANFTAVTDITQEAVISAEEVARVEFVNTYDDSFVGSGSINNEFTFEEDGWDIEQIMDR